ncbi:hypothetical protein [Shewanella waksmanii]|uniref:hypothetical protein n=1 Tax=Shewanella waksmanii TaxID=213783 RepID=UPI00048B02AC|nr:hypothetical protein [Shewanella waksmanii]
MSFITGCIQSAFWLLLILSPTIVCALTGALLSIEISQFSLFATTIGAVIGLGFGGFWAEYIRTEIGLGYFLRWIFNANHIDNEA